MSAGIYKMLLAQGATFNLALTYRDPAGVLIDLTGYSADLRVAVSKGEAPVLQANTGNGQIVIDGPLGVVMLDLPAALTATLTPGQYVYQLDLTSPGGQVTRLLEGALLVDGQV
ncbi:hypothetical protein [Limnohabitans sp.]